MPRTSPSPGLTTTKFNLRTINLPFPGAPVALPNTLAFSMVAGGTTPPARTVQVVADPVNYYSATASAPWIKLIPRTPFAMDIAVDPTGMDVGHYEGLVMVSRDTPVRVRFDIFDKPTVNVNCSSVPTSPMLASPCKSVDLNFTYAFGQPTAPSNILTRQFTVGSAVRLVNVDLEPVYVSPKTGNWLGVASRRGVTLPITLTAVVDPRDLAPGTYTGAIKVTSGDARNSSFMVNVNLTVTPYVPPAPRRTPAINSFENAATGLNGAISAGQLVHLTGSNLSCLAPPSVDIDGQKASILSAGDREISLVVPELEATRSRVSVRVTCGDTVSDPYDVPVADAAPELFTTGDTQVLGCNEKPHL